MSRYCTQPGLATGGGHGHGGGGAQRDRHGPKMIQGKGANKAFHVEEEEDDDDDEEEEEEEDDASFSL